MIMPNLPGGGLTVFLVCGVGFALVVTFALKEFRFSFHQRHGIELFEQRSYQAALRHLIQAEKLWMLRLSKQTMPSRAEDCKNLGIVLDLISQAAGYCSLEIETREYREAVGEMERFFSNRQRSSRDYPRINSTFRALQRQFRFNVKNIPV